MSYAFGVFFAMARIDKMLTPFCTCQMRMIRSYVPFITGLAEQQDALHMAP
jgi:hypothetical protein